METAEGGIIERTHAEEVLELSKVLNILAKFCQTEPAKLRALNLLPIIKKDTVEVELRRVEDIKKFGESTEFYVPFAPDFLRTALVIQPYLSIENFCSLKYFLVHTHTLKEKFKKTDIKHYFTGFHNYESLVQKIDSKIDQNHQIKDDASPNLYKIRIRKKSLNYNIKEILKELLSIRSTLFTDFNVVERNGRYVLPVKNNFKKELPGIIHSYSNSGETVFIEPLEITEMSAELVELETKEKDAIEAILKSLTDDIRIKIDEIEEDLLRVVDLDLLFARASYAGELQGTKPLFGDYIDIRNGFHPILKRLKDNVVPLNLKMEQNKRVLLISGPNAGGKTVVLKTVGLLVLMARCGLFIPVSEGTSLPFFEEVYADIGDEQSLESDLSTFAGHIKQINTALQAKNGNILVLLDELMNQTSVEEGSALAQALLADFAHNNKTVLATTHNENLKIFVSKREDMLNAGMEFTDSPTYRLIVGIPQPSNAIRLASQLGIDNGIIQKALSYLDSEKVSLNEMFEGLSKELKLVQQERHRLAMLTQDYEARLSDLKSKKKKELDELKERYKKEIIQSKRTIERLIKILKKEGPKPETIKEVKTFFEEKLKKEEESQLPYFPIIGELVKIRELNKAGKVIMVHQGKYKISLDNIYFWAEPKEIEPVSE